MEFVNRSLRLKVSLGVGLVLMLLLVPFNWLQYRLQRNAAIADLSQLAATTGLVAEHSLEGAMLSNNRPGIQSIVDSVAQSPEVRAVYLLNTRAVVAASPGGRYNGQQLDRASAVCQGCHRFPAETRPHSIVVTDLGQPVFRTMTPISNRPACQGCHASSERLNGALYVDFSMAGLNDRLNGELRTALLASAVIILFATAAIYALLSRLVITPMEQVGRALRRFTQGERRARAPAGSADEVGQLGRGFNDMAATIQAQEARADQLYAELEAKDAVRRQLLGRLTAAREEERRFVARELHDDLGQLLTGLSLHLKLGRQALPHELDRAGEHLDRAAELIGETIEQSHRLIATLRPTVLDDLGLIPALREELRQRLAPLGIAAELDTSGETVTLPPEIATTAFRIAQEAITNVIRHANAQHVRVCVAADPCPTAAPSLDRDGTGGAGGAGCLIMILEDDGAGLPEEMPGGTGHGLGILGMQERADALGGRLTVNRRAPRGTQVQLWLPLAGGPA